jgi:hypothetical protein
VTVEGANCGEVEYEHLPYSILKPTFSEETTALHFLKAVKIKN